MSKGNEINLIVSSDPQAGAFNRSADGSYFEIKLEDNGIQIPSSATQCYLSVEESTVWWTIPNVITGVNDKVYIYGPSAIEEVSDINLGIPVAQIGNGIAFTILGTMPLDEFQNGDIIKVTSTGAEYPITAILSYSTTGMTFVSSNTTPLLTFTGHFSRLRGGGVTYYPITLPQGLYDLNALQIAITNKLENEGASSTTEPIISLFADNAAQRVGIRFPFPTSRIDFSQPNTIRELIGFPATDFGNFGDAARTVMGTALPAFNAVNYLLLHTDLTNRGLRFNSEYSQVVSQILIDKPAGSQIISRLYNPPRISCPELIGATRSSIRVWLTNDVNQRVDTNGEYYSARIKLEYS
jgi:hypothetical protein